MHRYPDGLFHRLNEVSALSGLISRRRAGTVEARGANAERSGLPLKTAPATCETLAGNPSPLTTTRPGVFSAVVCPLTTGEISQALRNFARWEAEFHPIVGQWPTEHGLKPRLIFSFNVAEDQAIRDQLVETFNRYPVVRSSFSRIDVHFCNLPPEKDLYIRQPKGKPPKFGNKSGPNWQFYETMKACRESCKFVFLMETDCVPLSPGWLDRIALTCERNSDAWVVGAHYSGASPLPWDVARHINGNALYNVGEPGFWWFLDEILWPWMHEHITASDPNLAYDCAWETFLNREEMTYSGHHDWVRSRDILHRLRFTDTIINIGGYAEQTGRYIWCREDLLRRFPGCAVVHGPLADNLQYRRGSLGLGKPFENLVEETGPNWLRFAVIADGTAKRQSYTRSIWLVDRAIDKCDTITVFVSLDAASDQALLVELLDKEGRTINDKVVTVRDCVADRARLDFAVIGNHNYISISWSPVRNGSRLGAMTLRHVAVIGSCNGEQLFAVHDPFRA